MPADLIFKELTIAGFWLTLWFEDASSEEKQELFKTLIPLVMDGTISMAVDTIYALGDLKTAVSHSMGGRRSGKIILRPNQ